MQQFPNLIDGQVALSRADINTGIVLDENYKYATKDEQIVFTVFDDKTKAINFAKSSIQLNMDIEFYIAAKGDVFLLKIDRFNVQSY